MKFKKLLNRSSQETPESTDTDHELAHVTNREVVHNTDRETVPPTDSEAAQSYNSNHEYLAEELRRLDLQLMLRVAAEPRLESESSYSELTLLKEEISSLLNDEREYEEDVSLLTAELVRLEERIVARLAASLEQGVRLLLPKLKSTFNLSLLEVRGIIVCLAPELDRKYERIYAYLQNDISAKSPTVDFVLGLFTVSEEERVTSRLLFDRNAPLMKFLLERRGEFADSRTPLIARPLKLEDWVTNYLLGFQVLDERLLKVAQLCPLAIPEQAPDDMEQRIIRFVNFYYNSGKDRQSGSILYCCGPDEAGKLNSVKSVCSKLDASLLIVDVEKLLLPEIDYSEMLSLLGRHALLDNAVLCFTGFDSLVTEDDRYKLRNRLLLEMLSDYAPLTFILGQAQWGLSLTAANLNFMHIDFPLPDAATRKTYWETYSQDYRLSQQVDLADFSGNFRFTSGQIELALIGGENMAVWNGAGNAQVSEKELYQACYFQSSRKIQALATKIKAVYTWDMLVLPGEQMGQLREICNQVKYRSLVYGEWGFARRLSLGKGLNILFSGPPGSGKTMAAEVIANELNLEIYKIDVSQIVSKYIGETEKNLSKIFDEAETSNAILFFDEADALFGKRSEVKDAHDRYANVEISYLLQKMEEYTGIVILATNLNQNLDDAFSRRLHFKLEFPFPERKQRGLIWRGMFPEGAPLDGDLDFDFMAEKFTLAGGNIKNIALNAAFYAAHESCPIGMKQIMLAAKREYIKLGKTFLQSDYDPYHKLIEVK